MSNHIVKRTETIDVPESEIKEVKDTDAKEVEKVKVKFTEAHPVAWRRFKKVLKIVGGLAAVGGTVYAGQRIADSKRHYYTVTMRGNLDADILADGHDVAEEGIHEGDTAVAVETE